MSYMYFNQMPYQPQLQLQLQAPVQTPPQAPPSTETGNIRGISKLISMIGTPDISDTYRGGISIWSAPTLRSRGYPFLQRVEILDETIRSDVPVAHYSNVYIWVPIVLNNEQLSKILLLSRDFYYDRKKQLLIVRSSNLDTAVAQATVILLYSKGTHSFYNIVSRDLLKVYYYAMKNNRQRRAIYTILNTCTRHRRKK